MSTVAIDPLFHHHIHRTSLKPIPKFQLISKKPPPFHLICARTPDFRFNGASLCSRYFKPPKALSSAGAAVVETSESSNVTFRETFELERVRKV